MKLKFCFVTLLLGFVSHSAVAQNTVTFPHPVFSCHNTLKYNIYFAGIKTGWLTREETWNDAGGKISSTSYAGILGIGTKFDQHAEFVWSDEKGFVTTWFTQDVTGFKNREMKVQISDNGHDSHMVVNDEEMRFSNPDRAILDIDTISAQLRYKLLKQEPRFHLTRQASDMLEHYSYTVEPKLSKSYPQWGDTDVVPIKQDGADEVTMWFAPDMDYQLIEAKYHSMLLPGRMKLIEWNKECD
jgi:hypothetical protein